MPGRRTGRKGQRSWPGNVSGEAENAGPLRSPFRPVRRPGKAATQTVYGWKDYWAMVFTETPRSIGVALRP